MKPEFQARYSVTFEDGRVEVYKADSVNTALNKAVKYCGDNKTKVLYVNKLSDSQQIDALRLKARSTRKGYLMLPEGWYIETWYDRKSMNRVSQLKDKNGSQYGDAYYDGSPDSVPTSRESLVGRFFHREKPE